MAKTLKPATESSRMNVTSSRWQACAIQTRSKGDERTWITSSGWVWLGYDVG